MRRQSGANTVETVRAVKQLLDRSRELLPPDVRLQVIQDQSLYVEAALHEVQNHLVSGSLLATVIVLLFMRSWRSTLIAAVVIPAAILVSMLVSFSLTPMMCRWLLLPAAGAAAARDC